MKTPKKEKVASFDVDRFINKTSRSRRRTREKKPDSKAKPSAVGYTRASFDLPDDLHTRLKLAAVQEKGPMRDVVEEAIQEWLADHGY